MATNIMEQWTGREVSASLGGGRTLNRLFHMSFDAIPVSGVNVTEELVAAIPSVTLGERHPNWNPAVCIKIDPRPSEESAYYWTVTVNYAEPSGLRDGNSQGYNPTNAPHTPSSPTPQNPPQPPQPGGTHKPPRVSLRSKEGYADQSDWTPKRLANSVGQLFDPPISIPVLDGSLGFSRTYVGTQWSLKQIMAGVLRTNLSAWGPFAPYELLASSAEIEWAGNCWSVNWSLQYNPELWHPFQVLNLSWKYRKIVTMFGAGFKGPLFQVDDSTPNGSTTQALIKMDGSLVKENEDPEYMSFRKYRETNFNVLMGSYY